MMHTVGSGCLAVPLSDEHKDDTGTGGCRTATQEIHMLDGLRDLRSELAVAPYPRVEKEPMSEGTAKLIPGIGYNSSG